MGVCRLCHNEAILQRSHVIPKSLLKDVKDGESQLHTFEHQALPSFSNSDPKELLMCRACEQLLSRNYEQYGTELLKNRKNVIQHPDHIEFREFDYKKWYLYYLSIIWRASISSLNEFKNVDLGGLNEVLKNCILNNTLLVSDLISIDEFVVISMFRVTDKANKLPDAVLKKIMMHFLGITEGEDHLFFFMANGFLIQYQVTPKFMYQKDQGFNRTDSARNKHRYVKRLDITESRILYENFNWLMDQI